MRNELAKLTEKVIDPSIKASFKAEMARFHELFSRYLNEKARNEKLYYPLYLIISDWNAVKSPSSEKIIPYKNLAEPAAKSTALSKLAVLKLNGGLGTTMGCVGPKSAIEVRDGMTFLDLTVRQIEVFDIFNISI